jgi:hypothetical protein
VQKLKHEYASKNNSLPPPESPDNEIFLQPWYLSREVFLAVRQLLPSAQLLKMRYYFDDYGCLKCGKSGAVYSSNGMCARCAIVVRARVVASLKRRFERIGVAIKDQPIQAFLGGRTKGQITRLAGPLPRKGRQAKAHPSGKSRASFN